MTSAIVYDIFTYFVCSNALFKSVRRLTYFFAATRYSLFFVIKYCMKYKTVVGTVNVALKRLFSNFEIEGHPLISIISHVIAKKLDGPKIDQNTKAP